MSARARFVNNTRGRICLPLKRANEFVSPHSSRENVDFTFTVVRERPSKLAPRPLFFGTLLHLLRYGFALRLQVYVHARGQRSGAGTCVGVSVTLAESVRFSNHLDACEWDLGLCSVCRPRPGLRENAQVRSRLSVSDGASSLVNVRWQSCWVPGVRPEPSARSSSRWMQQLKLMGNRYRCWRWIGTV